MGNTAEHNRLEDEKNKKAYWRRWGPYLSERQWGTVREDYSANGDAWQYFPFDQAYCRAYRWGEDGIAGMSDNHQRLCFSFAFWNGQDNILKERLFGLTGYEGNHGEDVKEYYFYLDNVPSHAYMKYLYKYPQKAFPYEDLREQNKKRTRFDSEYELIDTGIFNNQRYFDIFVEYAKETDEQIYVKVTACNRGPDKATLHILPTLWFRNDWSWNKDTEKPYIELVEGPKGTIMFDSNHPTLGKRWLLAEGNPTPLFTENESNFKKLWGTNNPTTYVKDAFHEYLIHGKKESVNFNQVGTKACLHYAFNIAPGGEATVHFLLTDTIPTKINLAKQAETWLAQRKKEADTFYESISPHHLPEDAQKVQREAFAGMLWGKQFYYYVIEEWLDGDKAQPPPPESRRHQRNSEWIHLYNDDILSMPDKWEYPWFASWDTAFHTISLALIDPEFAKRQLMLLTREWYMHPNGQIPAYEWNFSDVNPPVQAWAAWRVYTIDKKRAGKGDILFLERVFQKLLLNFTWWVNRKDAEGKNIFQGGFLGLDNISVFDRSMVLPTGGHLDQADGTSWMGMFCLNMLTIALELAVHNPSYEDIASKFFEHFLFIAEAITRIGDEGISLWDSQDGFFYDVVHVPCGSHFSLKVRSMVGITPMFAVTTLDPSFLQSLRGFKSRFEWFLGHRTDLCTKVACMRTPGTEERRLLSIVDREKLRIMLTKILDEKEFLSPYGIRSISAYHRNHPYILNYEGREYRVDYNPAESTSGLFGGNSNWRGPIWFPLNYLIVESLQKFHYYLGNEYKVECPTGSGNMMTLWEVARDLSIRLARIFMKDASGRRPVHGQWPQKYQDDPLWNEHPLFYEYFHGDLGYGLGASHQTGWTGLVAKDIQQYGHTAMQIEEEYLVSLKK